MENKRYHIIIASVIFAIAMWISINMGYEYTVVKYIPVVLENMKEDHALKFPVPKYMIVRFKGTGWQLASVYLSTNVKYYIDAQSLNIKPYIVTGKDLAEHVKLPLSVQAIEVIPDTLILAVDESIQKRVPVVSRVAIACMDGYGQVGPVHISPESVVIAGSRIMLESIKGWSTIHKRYDKQRTVISEDVPVEESQTFSIDVFPQTIHYQVDIEHFAEKTFTGIPVNTLGVPANREIIFVPPKMNIIVRGGIEQLAKLTNDDFLLTVDYNTIVRDSSGIVVPALNSPQMVQVISKVPEQFQFVIRKKL